MESINTASTERRGSCPADGRSSVLISSTCNIDKDSDSDISCSTVDKRRPDLMNKSSATSFCPTFASTEDVSDYYERKRENGVLETHFDVPNNSVNDIRRSSIKELEEEFLVLSVGTPRDLSSNHHRQHDGSITSHPHQRDGSITSHPHQRDGSVTSYHDDSSPLISNRLPSPSWCSCSHCSSSDPGGQVCCANVPELAHHFNTAAGDCVTLSPLFRHIVLDTRALRYGDWVARKKLLSRRDNQEYRHLAYNSFVNLVSAQLGKHWAHQTLPSCVVSGIREVFPSPNAAYSGLVKSI